MIEDPRLSRESSLGLVQLHESVEIAAIDSVNDRCKNLFRRFVSHEILPGASGVSFSLPDWPLQPACLRSPLGAGGMGDVADSGTVHFAHESRAVGPAAT